MLEEKKQLNPRKKKTRYNTSQMINKKTLCYMFSFLSEN